MENKLIEKRRRFIINFFYYGIIIGVFYIAVNYAMGYIFPFLFAAILAVALQKPIRFIDRKLHLNAHGVISLLLVLLIVSAVVGVVVLVGKKLLDEISDLVRYVVGRYDSISEFIADMRGYLDSFLDKLPEATQLKVNEYLDGFVSDGVENEVDLDLSILSGPLSGAWDVVKGIPSFLLSVLVTIISCVFMTAEYDVIRDMILGFCSEEKGRRIVEAKRVVTKGVGKLVKAYATIMCITFSEVFLGLNLMTLLGVYNGGYIVAIALAVCVVDIVPVLGTGTVVIPWAIYSFITGEFGLGVGLVILYAVITVLRQAIEPKLVANQVGLPSIITIMAMFLGARLFGIFGVVLLPFTVIVIKLMLDEGVIGSKSLVNASQENENTEEVSE